MLVAVLALLAAMLATVLRRRALSSRSRSSSSQSSPVPYWERPLEYAPEILCRCNVKAPRWISWSLSNPGRWYYNCSKSKGVDCPFFKWHDDPYSEFLTQLLGDLRDVVIHLKNEVRNMKFEKQQTEQLLMEAKSSLCDADVFALDLQDIVKKWLQ